jgi:hypothetical protein
MVTTPTPVIRAAIFSSTCPRVYPATAKIRLNSEICAMVIPVKNAGRLGNPRKTISKKTMRGFPIRIKSEKIMSGIIICAKFANKKSFAPSVTKKIRIKKSRKGFNRAAI